MDIGIGGKAVVAMPQPGLDVLHGIAKVGSFRKRNRNNAMNRCRLYGWHRFYQDILLVSFVLLAHTWR